MTQPVQPIPIILHTTDMTRSIRPTLLKSLVFYWPILLAGMNFTAAAQTYTQNDQVLIADYARRLIQDKYLTNLEILTNYEASQPPEALKNHISGLVRDAFHSREVLVYNEFRLPVPAYTTIDEYVKDSRIYTGGKPVADTLDFGEARYDIRQAKDGQPVVNVYLYKQAEGTDRLGKPFRFRQLTEFRLAFMADRQQAMYHDFRLVGISKAGQWPSTAFTITAADVELAATGPKDLLTVLTALANQLIEQLPANTSELTLEMFTFQHCGVNNALSGRIFATLSRCLQKAAGIRVVSPSQHTGATLAVRGAYQQDLNNLQLVVDLYDSRTDRVLATRTNAELPLTWLGQQNLN